MRAIRLLFAVLALAAAAAQAREVQLNVIELDPDDIACGLRYPAIQQQVRQAMATMKAVEVTKSDYVLVVAIATVKRPLDCASDVNVTLRRIVPLADSEKFRTRDKLANLELCRHGGIVVSPIKDHERDFLKQVERSVMICFGQLVF
jgi:hypothetical protein